MTTTHVWTEPQKAWVAALRSGKYKQGYGKLRDVEQGCFCILGVACSISPVGVFRFDSFHTFTELRREIERYFTHYKDLPYEVWYNWLGLNDSYGRLVAGAGGVSLMSMNDAGALSFDQLADFIESNPERVFRP
jgi:hypothetical protein